MAIKLVALLAIGLAVLAITEGEFESRIALALSPGHPIIFSSLITLPIFFLNRFP